LLCSPGWPRTWDPQPPKCWDHRHELSHPACFEISDPFTKALHSYFAKWVPKIMRGFTNWCFKPQSWSWRSETEVWQAPAPSDMPHFQLLVLLPALTRNCHSSLCLQGHMASAPVALISFTGQQAWDLGTLYCDSS
jgi:hypothetical protein